MSKHDQNIATRFNIFRKTYVAKNMVDAAKIFGCSHSKISDIESGKRALDFNMVTLLTKEYKLNSNWLATGRGALRVDQETGKSIWDYGTTDNFDQDVLNEQHKEQEGEVVIYSLEALSEITTNLRKISELLLVGFNNLQSKTAELNDRLLNIEKKEANVKNIN